MTRSIGALLLCLAAAACSGGNKKENTTPAGKGSGSDSQSMNDKDPTGGGTATAGGSTGTAGGGTAGGNPGTGGGANPGGGGSGGSTVPVDPPVVPLNLDPDPAQAKAGVDAHLTIARNALAQTTPDPELALKEARLALSIDAANVDAAAYVAFAYYHKKLYDTAELVLDDLFKRDAAKSNAIVFYVYGLVYDHTNRPELAQKSYAKAVELKPDFASALVNVGVYQLKNGQYTDAVTTFEKLVQQMGRKDVVTETSLGSAYRGHATDFPAGPSRDDWVRKAEMAYTLALSMNPSYGPAAYNLGLLYLDNDPFPGITDAQVRVNKAKEAFEKYKSSPGFDLKLHESRMKDIARVQKKIDKAKDKAKKGKKDE